MAVNEKRIAKLAKKIAKIERAIRYGEVEDIGTLYSEIEEISRSLNAEEMVAIDEYIENHHLVN